MKGLLDVQVTMFSRPQRWKLVKISHWYYVRKVSTMVAVTFTQVLRLITETYARTCFLRVPWGMVWCWTVVGGYLLWSMMPCHHVLPSIFEGTCDKRLSAYAPVKYSYLDRHPFIFERMWAQNPKFEHINPKNLIHFLNFSMGSAGHLILQIINPVEYYHYGGVGMSRVGL